MEDPRKKLKEREDMGRNSEGIKSRRCGHKHVSLCP